MRRHKIRRILVPTDFSPLSLHALNHARRLAALTGGQITLLHVVEPYTDSFSGDSGAMATALMLQRNLKTASLARLRKIAKGGTGRSAIRIDCRADIGPIAATIREIASSERPDLIIMGTHGTTGFVDNLLGSNTYRTSTLSRVPVLGVHARMAPRGYKHIIYPVREHPHALKKLPLALMFATLFKSTVHILGFIPGSKQNEKTTRAACSVIAQTLSEGGVAAKISFAKDTPLADTTMRFAR